LGTSFLLPALRKFRATPNIEADVDEMRAEIRAQQSEATMSMLQLLRSSTLRMPLCIAIVMQLSQQLSGINGVSRRKQGSSLRPA
jgi:SP family facilitated glucose transporter-like MFS transporter 1